MARLNRRTRGETGLSSGETGKYIDDPANTKRKGKWNKTSFKKGEVTVQSAGGKAKKGAVHGLTRAESKELTQRMAKYTEDTGIEINPLEMMEKILLEEHDLPIGYRLDVLKTLAKYTHSAAATKTEVKTEEVKPEDYLDQLAELEETDKVTKIR